MARFRQYEPNLQNCRDTTRVPGPLAIIHYLHQDAALREAGWHLPTSTSTVWRILDENQRILRPPPVEHEPIERPEPLTEWQVDFKSVSAKTPNGYCVKKVSFSTRRARTMTICRTGYLPRLHS